MTDTQPNELLAQIALEYLKEKKRKRRWGIFYKVVFLALIVFVIYIFRSGDESQSLSVQPHAALIDIRGALMDDNLTNADNTARSLHDAYQDKGTKAVILRINSPGGSAVQADDIYREIMRYRKNYPDIKVYAVCTDICASAAYYIASAANEIYANPASLVGSIGVIYDGFGFVNTLEKLGVERRLITSGKYKGFLDPFSPEQPAEKAMLQNMLDTVHQQFEDRVKEGRGVRLKITPDTFSGLFWTGKEAKELGLIDDFGSAGYVAREIVKTENIIDYTVQENYFEELASKFGMNISSKLLMLSSPKIEL